MADIRDRDLLSALSRRKGLILTLTLAMMLTITAGVWFWPPTYEATGSLLIKGREYGESLFPGARGGGNVLLYLRPEEEVNSEIEVIRSRPVLERVVRELQLHRRPPAPSRIGLGWLTARLARRVSDADAFELAVGQLRENLRVEPSLASQVVRLRYRAGDPALAARVVNAVLAEYLKQHLAININTSADAFYAEQIRALETELGGFQQQAVALKRSTGIVSFPEQRTSLLKKKETFDLALVTVRKEIISKRSKVERIAELLKDDARVLIPLSEIGQRAPVADLHKTLVTLRLELETIRQRYNDQSRQVIAFREQIASVEAQIREEVNRVLRQETAELRKLEAEAQALAGTLRDMEREVRDLPPTELALFNLEKQIEDKQAALTALRRKQQDSRVSQASDWRMENVKVVSQPR